MRSRLYTASLLVQSLLYTAGGINHLWHTATYLPIMPAHYAHPASWVEITGWAEILGGIGLLSPATRRAAAIGIVTMLVGYFDVHIQMAMHTERFAPISAWLIYARLPLQFALIAWAATYARGRADRKLSTPDTA